MSNSNIELENDSVIVKRLKPNFTQICEEIMTDQNINLDSRLVLGWMVGRPNGWKIYISQMKRHLGVTDTVWRRIKTQLKEAGYYDQKQVRGDGGKIAWIHYVTDTAGALKSEL